VSFFSPSLKLIYTSLLFKVDGELWDLDRPLEKSCKLELLDFEHPEGKCGRSFKELAIYLTFYLHWEKRFSGILLRMILEKLQRDIMVVIYVSVLQLMPNLSH
jgi:hypothetical protein